MKISDNNKELIAGGIAGIVARTFTCPIDVLKIRLQVQESREKLSLNRTIIDIWKKGDGIRAFWKGNTAGILLYASYSSIQFSTFDLLQKRYNFNSFVNGGISALLATSITYPFDLLRTRMTISSNNKFVSNLKLIILGTEGFKGFFKGYGLTLSQVVPYMGCIFASHQFLSNKFQFSDLVSGAAAGFICKSIFMPVDVFRRRLQLFQTRPEQFGMISPSQLEYTRRSRDRIELFRTMWKREGLKAFFRGWSMAVSKSTPATALTFAVHKLKMSLGWCPNENVPLLPNSLQSILSDAQNNNFTFITVPIQSNSSTLSLSSLNDLETLKKWQRSLLASSDRTLSNSNDWSNRILFRISLKDANLNILLDYAAHMTVFAILFEDDWSNEDIFNLLILNESKSFPFKFYFKCNFYNWKKWKSLLNTLEGFKNKFSIGVIPELVRPLHPPNDFHYKIWECENLKGLIIDYSVFLKNSKGFPVLPRDIQIYLRTLKKILDSPIILKTDSNIFGECSNYIGWLFGKERLENQETVIEKRIKQFVEGFENVLQTPLQPLKDHLPSETYEIFEKDPVKYQLYEDAIEAALKDKMISGMDDFNIGVFGAGRGPLVQAALNAAQKSNCKIKITALEKSPNACLTLLDRFIGHSQVEVVYGDMRSSSNLGLKSFDLIVSELLGSFGDNELSPECLWPVEDFLKSDGIIIPQEYTSYLEPCYAPLLKNQVKELQGVLDGDSFDYGYVVYLNRAFKPASSALPLFTFKHPRERESENETVQLKFQELIVPIDGLIGYFDCKLYGSVRMSTVPQFHSPGMTSWFPMYFPLSTEFYPKSQNDFIIEFKRLTDNEKVWYEWELLGSSYIHNYSGKSFQFKLQ